MPFRDHEWENTLRDCSFFPAYMDYLYGIDTQPEGEEAPHHYPLLYPSRHLEPIRYTNSMPSRSFLYTEAPDVLQLHAAHGSKETGYGTSDNGPAVLDLRSPPVFPNMVSLVSPELVTPIPQSPHVLVRSVSTSTRPVSSAEMTRRKLLNASQQRPSTTAPPLQSSLQQFLHNTPANVGTGATKGKDVTTGTTGTKQQHAEFDGLPEQRRNPRRHATRPSLSRSSSATDVDSQISQMPPSRPPIISSVDSPTPLMTAQPKPQSAQIPLLRPGDLLTHVRYAAAPRENVQRMNNQITQLWNVAQHHPDVVSKQQAVTEIQTASLKAHRMVQEWEQKVRVEARARAKNMAVWSPERQQSFAQSQILPHHYEEQIQNALHNPEQHLPQTPIQIQSQQLQHGLPLEQVPNIGDRPESPRIIPHKLRIYIDAGLPNFLAASRLLAMAPSNPGIIAEQDKARAWQAQFRARLGVYGQQHLEDVVAKVEANRQASSQSVQTGEQLSQQHPLAQQQVQGAQSELPQSHSQSQTQQQPQNPHTALQKHIRSNVPRFFKALRIAQKPVDPLNLEALAQQQLAHDWMDRFKASLPPQGHQMMNEIVSKVMQARSEGRDWISEMEK